MLYLTFCGSSWPEHVIPLPSHEICARLIPLVTAGPESVRRALCVDERVEVDPQPASPMDCYGH